MASAILANSPGWKLTGPMFAQMRAPLISRPIDRGERQQQQGEAEEQERVAVALEVARRGGRRRAWRRRRRCRPAVHAACAAARPCGLGSPRRAGR